MKPFLKVAVTATLLFSGIFTAKSQTVSDFFTDNYAFKYRFNPAMPSEKSFLAMGIGGMSLGADTNIGISSFVFPGTDGKLVTGLHPSISADEFPGKLPDVTGVRMNMNANLLSLGLWTGKSFTSFEVNLNAGMDMNLPKGFFEFAKLGGTDKVYDMSDLSVSGKGCFEVALGHSRPITDALTIGFRLKGLLGVASAGLYANTLNLTSSKSILSAEADAQVQAALKGLEVSLNDEGNYDKDSKISFDAGNAGPAGFGGAIDLGATYKLGHFTFSAAVLDLGFIKWNYNIVGGGSGSMSFEGVEDLKISGSDADPGKAISDSFEDVLSVVDFKPRESISSVSMLNMKANAGVRYTPVRFVSLGAVAMLSTGGLSGSYLDARGGVTLNPLPFISLSGNAGISSYGGVCGGAISINLAFLNFYTSFDGFMGNVMPDVFAPIDPFRACIKCGLVLYFGKRHPAYK